MKSALTKSRTWIIISAILIIAISILSGCNPVNHPPQISLEAERELISFIDSCLIQCIASDDNGDDLTYEWWASGGEIEGEGAVVTWHAPEVEDTYSVVVSVSDGKDGIAREHVMITVKENLPPTITRLAAERDWVHPSDNCQIQCSAEDTDGDELSYEWSVKRGDISGTGPVVTWTSPDTIGLYDIAVVVTDTRGQEDTMSLTISVAQNQPPIIEGFSVDPENHKYFKEPATGYQILQGKSCKFECIVKDAGKELFYDWSTDKGEISGKGSVITWTAPGEKREATITVIVSDAEDNMSSKIIVLKVETCTCVFK